METVKKNLMNYILLNQIRGVNPVSIGDHIRKIRMELKLLQKDLARICGVTEDCIRNWEKNRSAPQIRFFRRIISFLDYMPFEVDLTTLSGKLKAYRHINGISQKQFGKVLGVDGATVCSWELEENKPHKAIMEKIDLMLKCSRPSALGISRWKNMEQINDSDLRAANHYEGLTYWTYNCRKKGGLSRMLEINRKPVG